MSMHPQSAGRADGLGRGAGAVASGRVGRRGSRRLRPIAECLEGRTLLSIGLDSSFGFGGISEPNLPPSTTTHTYSQYISAIALQDGQVVEVGTLQTYNIVGQNIVGETEDLFVTQLDVDGSDDATFGTGGTTMIPVVSGGVIDNVTGVDIVVQPDGEIDVLGLATPPGALTAASQQWVVAQLTPDGSLDTSFGNAGVALIGFGTSSSPQDTLSAAALALAPDGKIVAVGSTSTSTSSDQVFAIAQLNANGTPDTTFNGTGTTTVDFHVAGASPEMDTANAVVVQPNGAIVVAGSAQLTDSSSDSPEPTDDAVARLNPDGTLDTTFNGTGLLTFNDDLGGSPSSDSIAAVALSGSQIVLAGTASEVFPSSSSTQNFTPSATDVSVVRLNADGSFDTTFDSTGRFLLPTLDQDGTTFNTSAASVIAQPSGALLIGGTASELNGSTYPGSPSGGLLLSLTPTGALDTSFGTDGAAIIAGTNGDCLDGRAIGRQDRLRHLRRRRPHHGPGAGRHLFDDHHHGDREEGQGHGRDHHVQHGRESRPPDELLQGPDPEGQKGHQAQEGGHLLRRRHPEPDPHLRPEDGGRLRLQARDHLRGDHRERWASPRRHAHQDHADHLVIRTRSGPPAPKAPTPAEGADWPAPHFLVP